MLTVAAALAGYTLLMPVQRSIDFSNWHFKASPFWEQSTEGSNMILKPYDRASARNSRLEVRPGIKPTLALDAWFASEWNRVLAGRTPSRDYGRKATPNPHGVPGLEETAEIKQSDGSMNYVRLIALNPEGSINSMLYTADDRSSWEVSAGLVDAILATVVIDGPPTATDIVRSVPQVPRITNPIPSGVKPPVNPSTSPTTDPTKSSTAKMTSFVPSKDGFRFLNNFENSIFGPPISLTSSGLCGGMSYTALDYFLAGRPIPTQDYRPAHGSPLQAYLYQREQKSLLENLDKWADYDLNPFGTRTVEIFNWGLRERLHELMPLIDQGKPVELGLKGTSGGYGHDHQVLAIGYDLGKFDPNTLANSEDLKIFLCEPNYPGEIITMMADRANSEFYYKEHPDVKWRSYFVDGKYTPMTPPTVANPIDPNATQDGLVHALRLEFDTGDEELKGGYLHVDFTIVFKDGTKQEYPNISQSGRWLPHYIETVEVVLTTPRPLQDIRFLTVNTNNTAGPAGDIWSLDHLWIHAYGGGFVNDTAFKPPAPYRFVGLPLYIVPQ